MAEGATSLKGLRAQMGKNLLIYKLFWQGLVAWISPMTYL